KDLSGVSGCLDGTARGQEGDRSIRPDGQGPSGRAAVRRTTHRTTYTTAMDVRSVVPGLAWMGSYKPAALPRDAFAAVVLTAILVPGGMGYGQATGVPAILC